MNKASTTASSPAPQLGSQYRDLTVVGRGGMGEVWKALDTTLGKHVAIKLGRCAPGSNDYRRALNEARILAQLQHDNIVRVLRIEACADGIAIITEFIDAKNLDQVVAENGKLSAQECRNLLADCAQPLTEAHQQSVVHRDIKPSNILVDQSGTRTIYKIIDFGIARSLDTEQRLTKTGEWLGTPHYLSPEIAMGKTADVRADIFGLGCVAYYAMTGSTPHAQDDVFGMLQARMTETIPLLKIDGDDALAQIIHQSTQLNPDDRFQSCAELLDALRIKNYACKSVGSPKPGKRTQRIRAGAPVLITLLIATGGALLFWMTHEPSNGLVESHPNTRLILVNKMRTEAHEGAFSPKTLDELRAIDLRKLAKADAADASNFAEGVDEACILLSRAALVSGSREACEQALLVLTSGTSEARPAIVRTVECGSLAEAVLKTRALQCINRTVGLMKYELSKARTLRDRSAETNMLLQMCALGLRWPLPKLKQSALEDLKAFTDDDLMTALLRENNELLQQTVEVNPEFPIKLVEKSRVSTP